MLMELSVCTLNSVNSELAPMSEFPLGKSEFWGFLLRVWLNNSSCGGNMLILQSALKVSYYMKNQQL